MVKHTKGFKGLSKKVLSAILAASMIMTSSSFVMAAEPTEEPVPVESTANDVETTEVETEVEETEEATNEVATFAAPEEADAAEGKAAEVDTRAVRVTVDDCTYNGDPQEPEVKVEVERTEGSGQYDLVDESKYTVAYSNNTNVTGDTDAEKGKVVVTFIGDTLIGTHESETAYFNIEPLDLLEYWGKDQVTVNTDKTVRGFVYNGEKQYPTIESVVVSGVPTADGKTKELTLTSNDYDVSGAWDGSAQDDLTSAGPQQLRIDGKGNYTGHVNDAYEYTIDPADLSEDLVDIQVKDYKYTGNSLSNATIKKYVTVTDVAGEKDRPINNYTVEVINNDGKQPVDIGTYTIRIKVTDANFNADSYIDTTFNIVASESLESVVNSNIAIDGYSKVDGVWTSDTGYNGEDQFVEDSDISFGKALKAADYKIVTPEAEWVDAGEYEIVIEGRNTYAGQTVTVPVKIQPRSIVTDAGKLNSGFEVIATQGKHQSGSDGEVIVYVHDSGVKVENAKYYVLEEGVDYTYTVKKLSNDQKEVEITGIGNYTTAYNDGKGSVYKQTVKTTPTLDLNDPSISVEITGDYDWTGSQVKPPYSAIKVTEQDGSTVRTLTNNEYGVAYGKNEDAGEGTIVLTGKTPYYSGERVVTFKINGVSFADTFEVADIDDIVKGEKTWKDVKDAIEVTYKSTGAKYNNIDLKYYKDGEEITSEVVDSTKLTETGAYSIVIESKDGQFEGSLEVNFNVIGDDLKDLKASIAAIDDQVYTGKEIKPAVVVTVDKETLKEGEDYTVAYSNNVNAGSADVVVTGINDYSGTIDTTFNITKGQQTIEMTNPLQVKDLGNGSRATNSKNCTLKLGFGLEDKVNLSYSSDNEDVATVANGVITYQGVGECTITVTAKETDNCLEATLPIKVVVGKVGTPTFTPSVTSKTAAKSITVTSSTVRGADGFEVQYSVRSDWWRASTVDFDGTTNGKLYRQTIKTYHSNKKYYIRVRAYQVVDGAKVYSDWSPAKTATTK